MRFITLDEYLTGSTAAASEADVSWNAVIHRHLSSFRDRQKKKPHKPSSIHESALAGEWPLRCEMKPKPSTRLADDLPE